MKIGWPSQQKKNNGHISLADDRLCKAYNPDDSQGKSNQCGTAGYFGPEILLHKPCDY